MVYLCTGIPKMQINLRTLKESNIFLNKVLNNITSAIFVIDKDSKIQLFNSSSQKMFLSDNMLSNLFGNGIKCYQAASANANCGETDQCLFCDFRESLVNTLTRQTPTSKKLISRNFLTNGKETTKHLLFCTEHITYKKEKMVMLIIDEVTELTEQKIRLKEQNKTLIKHNDEKDKFLGIAAHDLRSPISAIKGSASIIRNLLETGRTNEISRFLDIIEDKSEFSIELINDLLDITKIETGNLTLNLQDLDYLELVKSSVEFNQLIAQPKKITIGFNHHLNDLKIRIDRNKTEQVLNNLLSNAIKFSPAESKVQVVVNLVDSYIITEIVDQGPGIPEYEIDSLFKPFHRTSVKASNGESSTGLGLSIVKKIVEGHNGVVNVKSTVGEGSVFSFSLPTYL